VQGVASEEKLISSAKQVASSTAQLLVACKVKADPDADSTKRLQVRNILRWNVRPPHIQMPQLCKIIPFSMFLAHLGHWDLSFVIQPCRKCGKCCIACSE